MFRSKRVDNRLKLILTSSGRFKVVGVVEWAKRRSFVK
jgi:hypothetical protein